MVDTAQCARDSALMKTLGVNTIRVYHVDPKADHVGCMGEFARAGIYPIIDLDTFDTYILPNDPWWNQTQHDRYAAVMDAFAGFDNALGFFVGNEIIAINNQSTAAPFIKAAARDMKAHRDAKGYRAFPIGYSAADIAELRPMLQDYLTCGGNASENIDFFALNSYEWCGKTNFKESGYVNLQNMAKNFPVPIFFSETGCNTAPPRTFEDQAAIFGPEMVADWSGSLVYEWIQEANHYGLIEYGPPVAPTVVASNVKGGFTRAGTPTPVQPDFDNLKSQWATIKPTGVARSDYNPSLVSTRACPASSASGWLVNGNVRLPSLGETFSGTYSPTPTATGSGSPTPTKNPAAADREVAGWAKKALVAVLAVFAFYL